MKLIQVVNELNKKYTDEYLRSIAKKYDGKLISDFLKDNPSVYATISTKGKKYFDDLTKNMIRKVKSWSDDEIEKEAKKYKHVKDFKDNSPKAFGAAKNRGPFITDPKTGKRVNSLAFYKKVTSHMVPLGNLRNRIIYVHEFRNEKGDKVAAYVGLTYDSKVRYGQHLTGVGKTGVTRDTPVTKFMRDNPKLTHVYKELTDYLDETEAVKKERYFEEKYKEDGWLILNIKRAGSLGGGGLRIKNSDLKDFVDMCYEKGMSLREMRNNHPNQVNLIYHRKLHLPPHNYLEKFEREKAPTYTDDSAFKKAMTYKGTNDIRVNDSALYSTLHKRKLFDKVRAAFGEKMRLTDKTAYEQALTYDSVADIRNKDYNLYVYLARKKMLDTIRKELEG